MYNFIILKNKRILVGLVTSRYDGVPHYYGICIVIMTI